MTNPLTCEHDWRVWPETDGTEQRCSLCKSFRKTPREEMFWLSPGWPQSYSPGVSRLGAVAEGAGGDAVQRWLDVDYHDIEARALAHTISYDPAQGYRPGRCGAVTTAAVRPEAVQQSRYGPFMVTVPMENGLRLWVFGDEVGRDLFVMEYAEHVRRAP